MVSPFVSFSLKAKLLSSLFRFVESLSTKEKLEQFVQEKHVASGYADKELRWDVSRAKMIPEQHYLFQSRCKRSLYQKMMAKSQISLVKELDLVKFLRRMRLFTYATLTLLNRRQQFISDNLSTMLIRESSDFDESTSDDGELNDENEPDVEHHSSSIYFSKNLTDQRLLKVYQIKRKSEDRKRQKQLLKI